MRKIILASALVGTITAGGVACGSQAAHPGHKAVSRAAVQRAPSQPSKVTATTPSALMVPRDLVHKTMGVAKDELAAAGFTNVVVAGDSGGTITDSDKVISAPEAGKWLAPGAKVRLIAASPSLSASGSSAASVPSGNCATDSSACYVDGQHCETGGCVNAARGLSPGDVASQRDQWLAQHPGYCAVGQQGAVAPC